MRGRKQAFRSASPRARGSSPLQDAEKGTGQPFAPSPFRPPSVHRTSVLEFYLQIRRRSRTPAMPNKPISPSEAGSGITVSVMSLGL